MIDEPSHPVIQEEPDPQEATGSSTAPHFTHSMHFTGKGGEYFSIWIVNLFLTIISLSFYRPWAKVRTMRYFRAHTTLDGYPFDYTANPKSLLKGHLLVIVLTALFQIPEFFSHLADYTVYIGIFFLCLALIYIFLIPRIIWYALRFRARTSTYREIPFSFRGEKKGIFLNFILLPLLSIFTLYLIYPIWALRQDKYKFNHLYYGNAQFKLNEHANYWRFFLKNLATITIATLLLIGFITIIIKFSDNHLPTETTVLPIFLLPYLVIIASTLTLQSMRKIEVLNNLSLASGSFSNDITYLRCFRFELLNLIYMICSLGLAYPWLKVRKHKFYVEHTHYSGASLDAFSNDYQHQGNPNSQAIAEEAAEGFDIDF